MSKDKQTIKKEPVEDLKVKDFIKKVQEDRGRLTRSYEDKSYELEALRKKQLQLSRRYKKATRNKNTVESGKAYLETVNELMQIESEEGSILREMRDTIVETEILDNLLTAYGEYTQLRKSQ